MKVDVHYLLTVATFGVAFIAAVGLLDRWLRGRARTALRVLASVGFVVAFVTVAFEVSPKPDRALDAVKALVAGCALGAVLWEQKRARMKRPVALRHQRFVAATLSVVAVFLYFNALSYGYRKFWHRWDQYHYYIGAKYFPELGYDGLYRCSVIAQDQIGKTTYVDDDGQKLSLDLAAEARKPSKKIRNLSGDNLLMPVTDILAHPEQCVSRFTPARWDAYKADILFFRGESGEDWWDRMQTDHGYNPPPVWTLSGNTVANLVPTSVRAMQVLGSLDLVLLLAMLMAMWWAFGWRVCAVGAIFWGCQASASSYWTLGAFLRQDWLLLFVLAACFARKRWFKLAGACLVTSALLRIFPGLAVLGWLTVAGGYWLRHRRMKPEHVSCLVGGTFAAVLLLGASVGRLGADSYVEFYHHTIEVHDQTPLTNHMGLRVLASHGFGFDASSGRAAYTKDETRTDPFEVWKEMRLRRYEKTRPVAYAVVAASFVFFLAAMRRIRSLWKAQCLGQIWIILLSQLTCYYYAFMILVAPLTRHRRALEPHVFGFAVVTQVLFLANPQSDDRYTLLTLASLAFCYGLLLAFAPAPLRARVRRLLGKATTRTTHA